MRVWLTELGTGFAVMGLGLAVLVLPCTTPLLGCPPAGLGLALLVVGALICLFFTGAHLLDRRSRSTGSSPTAADSLLTLPPISLPPAAPAVEKAAAPEPDRMAALSPKELIRLYEQGKTRFQSDALVARYIGQLRDVTVTVEDVGAGVSLAAVHGVDDEGAKISLFFDKKKWADRLMGLMPGDSIRARGKVYEVESRHVGFDHCEVLP